MITYPHLKEWLQAEICAIELNSVSIILSLMRSYSFPLADWDQLHRNLNWLATRSSDE